MDLMLHARKLHKRRLAHLGSEAPSSLDDKSRDAKDDICQTASGTEVSPLQDKLKFVTWEIEFAVLGKYSMLGRSLVSCKLVVCCLMQSAVTVAASS
jgi:hypothetical protein